MRRLPVCILLCCLSVVVSAQFKNDNVVYKTVDPSALCKTLEQHPGYLMLDVRSPGEYSDTSSFMSLNIGRLKGAINMDINKIGQRLGEINGYKDQPVFVYCSHSQRSRRVSKMLADSGFTKVYNINGGMTAIQLLPESTCAQAMIVSNNAYQVLSPLELCERTSKGKNYFLLDVRPDSAWKRISLNTRFNAYGHITGSNHIALSDLKDRLGDIPTDRQIILTDLFGGDAASAARLLAEKGFKNIAVLIEGIDRWQMSDRKGLSCYEKLYVPGTIPIINSFDFDRMKSNPKLLLLDVRSADEFNNRHKDAFRNIGHLKNAVHIPVTEIEPRLSEIATFKNENVIVYGFSSGSQEAWQAATKLMQNGFTNVKVLGGGIFNVRWTAFNVAGMKALNDRVEDVPEESR